MAPIPPAFADLVGAPHFAHLATINADGSPQSSPIWIARDADTVLFATDATYKKARNMARDPRVALSIQDEANLYRYLELRGRAAMPPGRTGPSSMPSPSSTSDATTPKSAPRPKAASSASKSTRPSPPTLCRPPAVRCRMT